MMNFEGKVAFEEVAHQSIVENYKIYRKLYIYTYILYIYIYIYKYPKI